MDTNTRPAHRSESRFQCSKRISGINPLALLTAITALAFHQTTEGAIGVNFGRIANNLPPATDVASLLKSQGITRIKIYDADSGILSAFSGTGVAVAVMVPNEMIQDMASNPSSAVSWVSSNLSPYYPSTQINVVMVGNEILTKADPGLAPFLLNAMKNVYAALNSVIPSNTIKVSTPHAFDVLDPSLSFPPSAGAFKPDLVPVMQPLLQFLAATSSVFMIDVYPYFAYKDDSKDITLEYALFSSSATPVTDAATGLVYTSLFDAQVDAVYAALERSGFPGMELLVSESGWPSAGDPAETGATVENSATYNQNLVNHVLQQGTPKRPGVLIDTYIFELFNENQKGGSSSERNFGLFYPNMTKVGRLSPLPVFPAASEPDISTAPHHQQQRWLFLLSFMPLLFKFLLIFNI